MNVTNDLERLQRTADLQKQHEEVVKDNDFIKLYLKDNINLLISLTKASSNATIILLELLKITFDDVPSRTECSHCIISNSSLEEITKISRSSIIKSLKLLEEYDMIKIIESDIGKIIAINPELAYKSKSSNKWKATYNRDLEKVKCNVVFKRKDV